MAGCEKAATPALQLLPVPGGGERAEPGLSTLLDTEQLAGSAIRLSIKFLTPNCSPSRERHAHNYLSIHGKHFKPSTRCSTVGV